MIIEYRRYRPQRKTKKNTTYQQRRSFDTEFDGATLALGAVVESGVVDVGYVIGIGHREVGRTHGKDIKNIREAVGNS